jgi:hypothetical protein
VHLGEWEGLREWDVRRKRAVCRGTLPLIAKSMKHLPVYLKQSESSCSILNCGDREVKPGRRETGTIRVGRNLGNANVCRKLYDFRRQDTKSKDLCRTVRLPRRMVPTSPFSLWLTPHSRGTPPLDAKARVDLQPMTLQQLCQGAAQPPGAAFSIFLKDS